MYEQVFPNMHKLVTFGSKTSSSLVNNQGSKITPGLFDFSRKTNFSSADDRTSLKPPGLDPLNIQLVVIVRGLNRQYTAALTNFVGSFLFSFYLVSFFSSSSVPLV